METTKLYYEDSLRTDFAAAVLECRPQGERWLAALDATCFYPEGGGQPADRGILGGARVLDVHEKDGVIWHTVDQPLEPGSRVEGKVDWARRLDLMQQHTGEHILSGLLHRMYGADNVGFHIGDEYVTMDTSIEITPDQLAAAEQAANEIVWRDEGVECAWPSPQELAAAEYRSKKALEGPVRLVTIPDADCCACCGTHLPRTGMVGQIKLLDWQRYKGGMRLTAVCGGRALADYRIKRAQLADAGALLSVPMNSVAPAVHRLAEENAALKQALAAAENQWFEALAAQVTPDQAPLVLAPGLSGESLRRLCLTLCQRTARPCAALSAGGMGLAYAVGQADGDVRGLVKVLNAALDGRGGGKPAIAMGSLRADFEAVGPVWAELTHTQ